MQNGCIFKTINTLPKVALSFPAAIIFSLAGGAIFGFSVGTIIISIASAVGATLAFLTARFLFRKFIENRFGDKLVRINEGVEKEGALYLITLRLAPAFPFFLVNLMMGLTRMKISTFFFVSFFSMLPGTVVYVNAGTQFQAKLLLNRRKFLII